MIAALRFSAQRFRRCNGASGFKSGTYATVLYGVSRISMPVWLSDSVGDVKKFDCDEQPAVSHYALLTGCDLFGSPIACFCLLLNTHPHSGF